MESIAHIFDENKADELPAPTLDSFKSILDRLDDFSDEVKADRGFVPDRLNACLDDLTAWYRAVVQAVGVPPSSPAPNSLAAALANLAPSLADRRPA